MHALKSLFAATIMTFAATNTAVAGQSIGYTSTENVITEDIQVSRIQKSLFRDDFRTLATVTNPVQYIVQPTDIVYQTAETIITMVGDTNGTVVEYASVHVPILYNSDSGTFSAGNVSVQYKTVR